MRKGSIIVMREHVRLLHCNRCDRYFYAVRWDARYCSNACRQVMYRARRKK
jgi:predicted nucleic acid-binding Zn ribbon protein